MVKVLEAKVWSLFEVITTKNIRELSSLTSLLQPIGFKGKIVILNCHL